MKPSVNPYAKRLRIRAFFAWYDLWIGAYIDVEKRRIYVCPLPCCVVMFELEYRSDVAAWRQWFQDSGAAEYWSNVDDIEAELGRQALGSDHGD